MCIQAKRIQLLKELLPTISRLAVVYNPNRPTIGTNIKGGGNCCAPIRFEDSAYSPRLSRQSAHRIWSSGAPARSV